MSELEIVLTIVSIFFGLIVCAQMVLLKMFSTLLQDIVHWIKTALDELKSAKVKSAESEK